MSDSRPRPPRIAERLLQAVLDEPSRDAVLGDLHEGYDALRQRGSAGAAARWYWLQAVRSLIACRITGRRQHQSRRYDFDPSASFSVRDLLRPAFRQFRDQPLYALASTGTLALAVGVACVSFTLVKRAFIDPLPYRAGHELVSLMTLIDGATSPVSPHVLEDLRASNPPLVAVRADPSDRRRLCVEGRHRKHQHQRGERRLLRAAWRDAVAGPDLGPQEPNAVVDQRGVLARPAWRRTAR